MNEICFAGKLLNLSTFTSLTVHFSGDEFFMWIALWFKLPNVSPLARAFMCTPGRMCPKTRSFNDPLSRTDASKLSFGTIIVNGVSAKLNWKRLSHFDRLFCYRKLKKIFTSWFLTLVYKSHTTKSIDPLTRNEEIERSSRDDLIKEPRITQHGNKKRLFRFSYVKSHRLVTQKRYRKRKSESLIELKFI